MLRVSRGVSILLPNGHDAEQITCVAESGLQAGSIDHHEMESNPAVYPGARELPYNSMNGRAGLAGGIEFGGAW